MAFTYPWFLLGLFGVAVPIAIHLFELRKPQRVLFSNVEFIREVKLVTARQRRVKHWLVLLTRIGLVVSLVLLFAQPFIPAPQAAGNQGQNVQLIVDTSPSMQQIAANDRSVLEQAIEEAGSLPLAFPQTARFQLWPGSQEILGGAALRGQVEQLQVTGQTPDVHSLVRRATQPGHDAGPLFVFSDFQRNSFTARTFTQLDSSQQVFLIPLAGKAGPNVFVDSVWLDDAFVRVGSDLMIQVRLRNGGQQTAENCQAKVFVGKQQAAVFRATVPAQRTVTTQLRLRVANAQTQLCRVEVTDFPVEFDNTFYFTLQPAQQIQITEIGPTPALNKLYSNEPLFGYQFTPAQAMDYQKIQRANLLIIHEVAALAPGLRDNLRRAVQQGATLVVVPAAAAGSRQSYGELFRELGLGPVQWQPVPTAGPVLQEVAMPSRQDPFFRDVFAGANARAGMPKAASVLRWARSGSDVLRLRDGESYLSGFTSGAGKVYVFAAPFSAPYSDFAQHPLFVPVLYRLAMQSYQQEQQPAYRLNQPVVTLRLPATAARETAYRLVQDSLTYIPVQQQRSGTLLLELPPTLRQPGFYQLQRDGRTVATLALNYDKRESDLRSYSAADLRQLVGPSRPNVQVYETGQGQTVAARYKAQRVGVPLWRYCVWAALLFLLAEGLLLRWNRRTVPTPSSAVAA